MQLEVRPQGEEVQVVADNVREGAVDPALAKPPLLLFLSLLASSSLVHAVVEVGRVLVEVEPRPSSLGARGGALLGPLSCSPLFSPRLCPPGLSSRLLSSGSSCVPPSPMPASCREGLSSSPGPTSGGLRIAQQAASEAELRTVLADGGIAKALDPEGDGLVGLD